MSEAQNDERSSPRIDLESAEDSSGVDLGLPRLEGADRDGVRAGADQYDARSDPNVAASSWDG